MIMFLMTSQFVFDCCCFELSLFWRKEGRNDLEWRGDLNEGGMWFIDLGIILISFSHSMGIKIGSSGACSLSEALKVNSSLTQLDLWELSL